MQRELPILGNVKRDLELVSDELLDKCKSRLDAIRLCVQLSGMSNQYLSEALRIDKGHFTRIMQGRAHFPDCKSLDLMQTCGNYAPMQFEVRAMGYVLSRDERAHRRQELLRELAEIEAA